MGVGIADIAYALPESVTPSNEIVEAFGFDESFIVGKLGIESRHHLAPGETVSGLAAQAVEAVLKSAGIDRSRIGLLIVVTQTPDYCLPHVSAIVQGQLGLPRDSLVFDMSLGCSGYVIGLATAKSLMKSERIDFGVLVTVDAYSRLVDKTDRETAPLFGDAAAATLLSRSPQYAIGSFSYGSDGARHEDLIAHGTGSTLEPRQPLHMDGRGIYTFALREVPNSIKLCLALNSVDLDSVQKVVLHQANNFMVGSIGQRLGVEADKMVLDIRDIGNTTSSSIPIAIKRSCLELSPLPSPVLLSGFGVGLSWATTILFAAEGGHHESRVTRRDP